MSVGKMHPDELDIQLSHVARMVAHQFPQWASLPIVPVPSAGTDHALFRMGEDMVVRLPRIYWAVDQVATEQRWLPRLAPHLPLDISTPLAQGAPDESYPWPWSVYRWLGGENATIERIADPCQAATALAQFIRHLQEIDATNGPLAIDASARGVPLAMRDVSTRKAIDLLRDTYDILSLTTAWEKALQSPTWAGPPVWLHGDLQSGNLLAQQGKLSAVIDFGCLAVGDPACDLMPAWNLFSGDARDAFRTALQVDDATWSRGRGWALSVALIALPYYKTTNPTLAGIARHTIEQVLNNL